ncbi:MAG: helix-hairpin-helix domain-containing protein, partial [Myxococcota bacterium]
MSETQVTGVVEALRIFNELWGIGTLQPPRGPTITVTGNWPGIDEGATVVATGAWSNHPRYGRQLKAERIERVLPSDTQGVVRWLVSRLPDVGPGRATALVERFGVNGLWELLDEGRATELAQVPGITPARAEAIVAAYAEHRDERDRMVRLRGWGLTDGQIGALETAWGERLEERLRENPYSVIEHVRGFGFKRADVLARKMGLRAHHPARIAAGLLHVMGEARAAGHTYVPAGKLMSMGARLLGLTKDDVRPVAVRLKDDGRLVGG